MAKKSDKQEKVVNPNLKTPTEVVDIITESLLRKPNKKVVFATVVKNEKFVVSLLENLIKYSSLGAGDYANLSVLIKEKFDETKAEQIKETEAQIDALKKKLEDLKA